MALLELRPGDWTVCIALSSQGRRVVPPGCFQLQSKPGGNADGSRHSLSMAQACVRPEAQLDLGLADSSASSSCISSSSPFLFCLYFLLFFLRERSSSWEGFSFYYLSVWCYSPLVRHGTLTSVTLLNPSGYTLPFNLHPAVRARWWHPFVDRLDLHVPSALPCVPWGKWQRFPLHHTALLASATSPGFHVL